MQPSDFQIQDNQLIFVYYIIHQPVQDQDKY